MVAEADVVLICPSNPVVSIGPILVIPAIAEAIDGRRPDQFRVGAIATGAAVAIVVGKDDDDVRPIGGEGRQREEQAEQGAHGGGGK